MDKFENYRAFLQEEYLKKSKANPHFSLRSFARFLEISPGALSEILKGKRKLTYKNAMKIASKLGLSNIDTKKFITLLDDSQNKKAQNTPSQKELSLSEDMFSIISNWYCFAILNLVDCEDFRWSHSWIAKRLQISLIEVKSAIEKMVRIGLIKRVGESFQVVHDFVLSPDGIPSHAVREYHKQILEKSLSALETQRVDEREISGISFALDSKRLDELKADIDEFQRNIIEKYCRGKRDEVYHLEAALFRLTK